MTVTVEFPCPDIPLITTPRQARADRSRAHHHGWQHSWRTLTTVYLLEQIHGAPTDVPDPAFIHVEIPLTTTWQRGQAPLFHATVDAIADGLLDAACWPDHTHYTTLTPILRPAHHTGLWTDPLVTIRITPRTTR